MPEAATPLATPRVLPRSTRGLTIVESVIALTLLALFMLAFLRTFIASRQVTESNVMHAAATSIVYGLVEQIKQLDYTSALPSLVTDPSDTSSTTPPYVRVRLNQSTMKWVRVVYTDAASTPQGPLTTPSISATPTGAIDNDLGTMPLTTVTGIRAQSIRINLWVWIDEIPDEANDVAEVKKITVIYTYSYQTPGGMRTARNREVFIRTRYDQ